MNLPNRLTISRTILIVPMVILLCLQPDWCRWTALAIFAAASATDFLDGHIARKNHLVTNFGKFLDPVADKMLVLCAMICLTGRGELPAWFCAAVACRELMVDGLRLIASQQGIVMAAGKLGKLKTVSQIVTLIFCIARLNTLFTGGEAVKWALLIWTLIITVVSGADYFIRNRTVLKEKA